MKNTDRYKVEKDADFDLQEEEALYISKKYPHLSGTITFFAAMCPGCGCTMPFELDEGVCMKCGCDPAEGIVDDMTESELERLLHNNRHLISLPHVRRHPFETLPKMLERQIEFRCKHALKQIEETMVKKIMYIARDKDGKLFMYEEKPLKQARYFTKREGRVFELKSELYPEITFENSPKKLLVEETVVLGGKPYEEIQNISDGYHTFKELYAFILQYNAAIFNEWAKQGLYDVHKSKRHSDGEVPFGKSDWFIVMAELPTGQVSKHYEMEYWDLFQIPEKERANTYDGHSPQDVIKRLLKFNQQK